MGEPPVSGKPPVRRSAARVRPVEKPKNMKGTIRRLLELTRGHRRGLGWILLLSILTSASAILSPLIIGKAVTAIDGGSPVMGILALLLAVYLGDWLVRFLQQFMMASIGQRIIHHIRIALFEAIKNKPLSFFDKRQHGELMSRLTNDIDNISSTLSDSLTLLLTYLFTITGIFCVMLAQSPLLLCVALVGVVLICLMTRLVTKRTRKLYKEQQTVLGALNGHIEESVSEEAVIKAFRAEDEATRKFDENNERLCKVATKALIWSGFLMPLTNVINNLSFVAVSVASAALAIKGAITIGTITSFLLYTRQFSRPFVNIASIYNSFQSAVAGAERVFEIMDAESEPEDAPDALPFELPRGDFELRDVVFGYDPERPVLKGVSLKIPAGTKIAIVGPTGAGKTTIINLLTRFYDVTDGEIRLDGQDLRRYKMKDLRRAFGVVLQDTALFAESVKDNIRYGKEDVTMEDIVAAARTVGADGFIRRLPKGYDTVLTRGGMELSQGERQQLTIARAILADAPILILDEATSSVDTLTERKIRNATLKITEGRTSFIIAHRLSTIRDSDLIILIEDGRIAERGTHEELMTRGGGYAAMYRTQMGLN